MSFKFHIIVVSSLIFIMIVAWVVLSNKPAVVAASKTENSTYSVTITHASWGLNCLQAEEGGYGVQQATPLYLNEKNSQTLKPDNVLVKVSALCNGKLTCTIPIKPEILGTDPAPDCFSKLLEVEYRCFSFDRPWTVHSGKEDIKIDCNRKGA